MPVNLTSYTGNANLGESNANIPVIEKDTDLNVLNKADENAMLLNHENNVRLFQQKVSDRAYLQNLINEGKFESGDIDDKDRPAYDTAEKDATDAYKAIKGVNDTQGLENYRQKVLALQNVTKAAQGRWVAIKQQEQDIANEPLPSKQKAMQSHLDAETKTPVYSQITPYQKALDLNIPDMDAQSFSGVSGTGLSPSLPTTKIATTNNGGKIKQTVIQQVGKGGQTGTTGLVKGQSIIGQPASTDNTATGTTDNTSGTQVSPSGKLSPISVTPTTIFDYDKLRDNNARLYSDNEEHRLNQDMFVSGIESGKIGDTKEIIDYANDKINQYNQISGKQVKPFVEGVDYIRNPQTGQIKFNLPTSEVVSKLQLAKLGQFKTGGQEIFNKDVGDYLNKQTAVKALAAERYSKANLNYKKSKAIDNQFNPQQTFDDLFKGKMKTDLPSSSGIMGTITDFFGNKNKVPITTVNQSDLSKEMQDNLGINPINQNGDYNLVPSNVKFNGKVVDESTVEKGYGNWIKSAQAARIKNTNGGKTPSVFDFIYSVDPHTSFEVEVEGTVKPQLNKEGQVINKDKVGRVVRSNRLQSLISQMNKGGVKGKELVQLLSGDNGNSSETEEETIQSK